MTNPPVPPAWQNEPVAAEHAADGQGTTPPVDQVPPGRRRSARPLVIAIAVLVALGGIGTAVIVLRPSGGSSPARPAASASPTAPAETLVIGTVSTPTLIDFTDPTLGTTSGSPCRSKDGYDDVAEGADVTVYDQAAVIVGSGRLEAGELTGIRCVYRFRVSVITGRSFYKIKVAGRDGPSFSAAEITSAVELTLG
jgi:hypothetical protein